MKASLTCTSTCSRSAILRCPLSRILRCSMLSSRRRVRPYDGCARHPFEVLPATLDAGEREVFLHYSAYRHRVLRVRAMLASGVEKCTLMQRYSYLSQGPSKMTLRAHHSNPTAEWIELRSAQPLTRKTATIFDLAGKVVFKQTHRSEAGQFRIDVRDLEPGAYHIRLSGTWSDRTLQFIKL